MRKYTLNEAFFESIDTEEKAYWLGFITADGHWRTNGTLQINLQAGDIEHLRKLAGSLGFDGPVFQYLNILNGRKFPRSRIAVCSKKLCKDIEKHSVVSYTTIPIGMLAHFWRGVVDGDGHLDNYSKPRIRLVGKLDIVNWFVNFTQNLVDSSAKIRPHYSIWQFELVSNKAKKVIEELYGRATIALDRKLSIANEILGNPQAQEVTA